MNALFDAIKTLGIIPKIVHTDQGSEYQSKDYAQMLSKLGSQGFNEQESLSLGECLPGKFL